MLIESYGSCILFGTGNLFCFHYRRYSSLPHIAISKLQVSVSKRYSQKPDAHLVGGALGGETGHRRPDGQLIKVRC